MQSLRILYGHTGRAAEWARLVEEIVPEFVDPTTEGPLPGRQEEWSLITEYRVRLTRETRRWEEAERLQWICVDWDRHRARGGDRNRVVSLDAVVAFNHGTACQSLPAIRDLGEAERRYRRSLELRAKGDRMGRAKCLGQLGSDAYERFREARNTKPAPELMRHLNDALGRYRDALDMTPPDAVGQLAPIHNELGNIYGDGGDLDRAPHHCRESIRLNEARGDPYGAATTRRNLAITRPERFPNLRR